METSRLRFRKFQPSDFQNMRKLESNGEIMKFTPMRFPLTEKETLDRLNLFLKQGGEGIWAIEGKLDAQFIGWIMLKIIDQTDPELGFMIVQDFWGNGYAFEAAEALVNHGFHQLNYGAITATTDADNSKSKSLLIKLGFEFEKCITRFDKKWNKEISLDIFRKRNPHFYQA
jgi:ribosomal-protein-alanine N-acetyltransferase